MPRSRSGSVRRANPGWHGIERLETKSYFENPQNAKRFYTENLAHASRLEVEQGSGSGHFLLAAAKQNPQTLFVGIEYAAKFMRLIRDRLEDENLSNVLLLSTDGKEFIRHCLPDESVDAFHVYFPDPWPKRADQKKRSLSPSGLEEFVRALKNQGLLYFTTDHRGYAESVESLIQKHTHLKVVEKRHNGPCAAYGLETHFGKKYLKSGRDIYSFVIGKIKAAASSSA